jgi:mitochondrial fission protein ELM1
MPSRETWILTEGLAGTEAPCRGLARALGREAVIKRVRVRQPWDSLPARLWFRPLSAPTADSDRLAPPWPELLISSGNVAAPLAAAIRRASGGATRVVHVQNPKMDLAAFDLVIAPRHDGIAGANVIVTRGTLHALDPAALETAKAQWAEVFSGMPRPLVAFLCGGSNGRFELTPTRVGAICTDLRTRMAREGIGLAVTASRRTGAVGTALLHAELGPAGAYVWNGEPPNPYLGLLAHADIIAVTQDSVSMISEALGTGKPVYWLPLDGRSRRLQRFVDSLTAEGVLRRWPTPAEKLETWSYQPPDDTARAAAAIRARFGW